MTRALCEIAICPEGGAANLDLINMEPIRMHNGAEKTELSIRQWQIYKFDYDYQNISSSWEMLWRSCGERDVFPPLIGDVACSTRSFLHYTNSYHPELYGDPAERRALLFSFLVLKMREATPRVRAAYQTLVDPLLRVFAWLPPEDRAALACVSRAHRETYRTEDTHRQHISQFRTMLMGARDTLAPKYPIYFPGTFFRCLCAAVSTDSEFPAFAEWLVWHNGDTDITEFTRRRYGRREKPAHTPRRSERLAKRVKRQ